MSSKELRLPAALLIIDGSKLFTVNKPVTRIGRGENNDLIINSMHVSRKHAEIRFEKGRFEICDLDSKGGTYVNGERVGRRNLSKGDVITLANTHLVFGEDDFPAAESPSSYVRKREKNQRYRETKTLPFLIEEDKDN